MFIVHVAVGPANRSGAAMNERSDRAGDASRLPFNRRTAMRVAGAAGLAGLVATVLSGDELAAAGNSEAVRQCPTRRDVLQHGRPEQPATAERADELSHRAGVQRGR